MYLGRMGDERKPTTDVRLVQGGTKVKAVPGQDRARVTLALTQEPDADWQDLFLQNEYRSPPEPGGKVQFEFEALDGMPVIACQCSLVLVERVRDFVDERIGFTNEKRAVLRHQQERETEETSKEDAEKRLSFRSG